MNTKNPIIRKGSIVKVKWREPPSMNKKTAEMLMETRPTIGRVIFAHPQKYFYVVEFRDRYTAEYKPMYRQSFFPEQLERIHQPNFMRTRPAKKKSWAQEGV